MRFGIAVTDITPDFPTKMHGYGAREDFYDGVNDRLTFTALVLEENGRRMMIGAADICTFHRDGSVRDLMAAVGEVVACPADNVMLNASHTHGGPAIADAEKHTVEPKDFGSTKHYAEFLRSKVLEAAEAAAGSLAEGTLWLCEGETALPMNRRPMRDGHVVNAPNPDGSTDNRMPLLVLKDAAGAIKAIGAKVACHPVTTGAQHLLTADYPGAWREAVRTAFNGQVIPFFLQGSGADTRPHHAQEGDRWVHRPHSLLPRIGRELCADMLKALTEQPLRPIENLLLKGKLAVVAAPCERTYATREDFERFAREGENKYEKTYGAEALWMLDHGETIPDQVDFFVQTVWLNEDIALIGLNVEPLLALGRHVEDAVAPKTGLLLGYTNGCVSYAPDAAELARGGYEANSYIYRVWSGPLKPGLERVFADGVVKTPDGLPD